MTSSGLALARRVVELRSAFDRGFAAPLNVNAAAKNDLLAARIGEVLCAIRLAEIAGLFVDRKLTRVPGGHAALLGIAGFRGALIPVYSLGVLLGHSGSHAPRWLVIAVGAPVAFAFDAFEGHLRAFADVIVPQQSQAPKRGYAPDFICTDGLMRPVLHLPSIISALDAPKKLGVASKEE